LDVQEVAAGGEFLDERLPLDPAPGVRTEADLAVS
jgi:hypothetical protein